VEAERIADRVARTILDVADPVIAYADLSTSERRSYLGRYLYGATKLAVSERDGELAMETPGGGSVGLRYTGDGSFAVAGDSATRVSFAIKGGKPNSFVLTRYGRALAFGARLE
jgi:hypothetical protein